MNKKALLVALLLGVAILTLSVASPTFAAEPTRGGPGGGDSPGGGNGRQGTTGTGTGIPVDANINLDGVLSDLIHANLAIALDIPLDELTARLDAGETFSQIALSEFPDLDPTAISNILVQARADALAQAVEDGLITQEQADWLASRDNQNPAASYGDGICDGTGDCIADGICDGTGDCTADGAYQQRFMMKNSLSMGFGR
jgi:hypothetical protein